MHKFFSAWLSRIEPVPLNRSRPDEFGKVQRFNPVLEDGAAKRFIFRRAGETDTSIANRWALAVCELQEELANENAELERELDVALSFTRGEPPCDP